MVENEKLFSSIADDLYELLNDKIFVAHNVNFDYSFLKYHLAEAGHQLNCKKLCTIRLGRQILPGLPSYSLGNMCKAVGITIDQRHRAGGDAAATVKLFRYLLEKDTSGCIQTMLKAKNKEQQAPPNLPVQQIRQLPDKPGVYYFHDQKGKVIYVGKAKSLARRVNSHFANNNPAKQKQEFLRMIHNITYQRCGTELMAFILESVEIRKLWPRQNRSQKRFEQTYALYAFEDRSGYLRLAIEKKNRNLQPLYTFNLLAEGHNLLKKLCTQFKLCPVLCFLQSTACSALPGRECLGACEQLEPHDEYNTRVRQCLDYLHQELPTFALVDNGINYPEQSCILMEKGRFYGMGYLPESCAANSVDELKNYLTPYPENDYIRGLVYQYAAKFPHKKMLLS